MGKRSDFQRMTADRYQTPRTGVLPLLPHLHGVRSFAEPCVGEGKLVRWLEEFGYRCTYQGDIGTGQDALSHPFDDIAFDAIITNPPWTRSVMHPLIERFMAIAPTWLLFDADWAMTLQSRPYMRHCSTIVPIGRLKWFENSPHTGMDNCAWYRFHIQHVDGPRLMSATPKSNREPERLST